MDRRVIRAAVFDLLAIVVFVALGRRSHDEGSALSGTVAVAGPFLIAAAVAWLAFRVWRRPDAVVESGVPVWLVTVALGMVLRNLVFDRGTAVSFIVVATVVLGALLLGWRAVVARRRSEAAVL